MQSKPILHHNQLFNIYDGMDYQLLLGYFYEHENLLSSVSACQTAGGLLVHPTQLIIC